MPQYYSQEFYAPGRGVYDPLDLAYFQGLGYMPGNCKFYSPAEWPAFDFQNLNGGSVTRDKGKLTFTSSTAPANFGWDLGAGKSKILFVISLAYPPPTTFNLWQFISDTAPATSEIPDSSYCFIDEWNSGRWSGGDWNGASFDTFTTGAGSWTLGGIHSMALYWEDSGNILKGYSRELGVGSWSEVYSLSISTVSSFRYVGLRPEYNGAVPVFGAPVAIYYE